MLPHSSTSMDRLPTSRQLPLVPRALVETPATRMSPQFYCLAAVSLLRGIPQGSYVGPVLFIPFHHSTGDNLFADDLSILIAPSTTLSPTNMMPRLAEQIKEALKQLLKYAVKYRQEINLRKTGWILFHRQVAPRIPDINVDGNIINHLPHSKYHGTLLKFVLTSKFY